RQQRVQFVDFGMTGDDALEHIRKPGHWIHAIQLGSLNQCHSDCPMTGSSVTASKECIFPCQSMWADGALDCVRVHLDTTIVKEGDQARPVPDGVAHRLPQIRSAGYTFNIGHQPIIQGIDNWSTALLADPPPMLGCLAPYLRFNCIQG